MEDAGESFIQTAGRNFHYLQRATSMLHCCCHAGKLFSKALRAGIPNRRLTQQRESPWHQIVRSYPKEGMWPSVGHEKLESAKQYATYFRYFNRARSQELASSKQTMNIKATAYPTFSLPSIHCFQGKSCCRTDAIRLPQNMVNKLHDLSRLHNIPDSIRGQNLGRHEGFSCSKRTILMDIQAQ